MRDVRRYWSDRRAIEAGLPEFVWLVSGESVPAQVPAAIAAGLLHAKTHRIATDDEIGRESARTRSLRAAQKRTQLRKQGIAVVGVVETRPESDTIRA